MNGTRATPRVPSRSLRELSTSLVLGLAAVAGCASPPETVYLTLRGADPVAARAAEATAPIVLVDRFVVDDAYSDERLAYRRSPSELGFDPYSRWAGPPATQVEDAVREHLRASGLFASVRQTQPLGGTKSAHDLIVTGRVLRLEEQDGESQWKAALEVELYLLDGRTRAVLQSVRFAKVAPTERRNPRDVATTLASLLGEAVRELLSGAGAKIVRHP